MLSFLMHTLCRLFGSRIILSSDHTPAHIWPGVEAVDIGKLVCVCVYICVFVCRVCMHTEYTKIVSLQTLVSTQTALKLELCPLFTKFGGKLCTTSQFPM